ncbi:MAG: WD40 repeat domain-containing protein, partial [Aureliella sp.]
LVVFADGQFVLARRLESTCLYSLTESKPVWNVGLPGSGMGAALAASEKSGLFASVTDYRVDIGEIATGRRLTDKGTSLADHSGILDVAFALDGRKLVLTRYDAILLFDIDSHEIKTVSREATTGEMAVSPSGRQLAFASDRGFKVRDLENNRLVFGKSGDNYVTALCFSPDGSQLAVGDAKGRVTCFDTASWKTIWATRARGHYAPPWTLSAGLLVGWIWALWRLMRHAKKTSTAE